MSDFQHRITNRVDAPGSQADVRNDYLERIHAVLKKAGGPAAWAGGLLTGSFALLQAIDVHGAEFRTHYLLAAALAFGLLAIAAGRK